MSLVRFGLVCSAAEGFHTKALCNLLLSNAACVGAEGFFIGAAKHGFSEGAAKLCFSLMCSKLLGKLHFQGFLFVASYWGNRVEFLARILGRLLLQQALRKLLGKFHNQGF